MFFKKNQRFKTLASNSAKKRIFLVYALYIFGFVLKKYFNNMVLVLYSLMHIYCKINKW